MRRVGAEPVLSEVEGCPHLPSRAQPASSGELALACPDEDICAYVASCDLQMTKHHRFRLPIVFFLLAASFAQAQSRRKAIINEDCSGPGGSNMQTLLLLIQSPEVEVLGITVVSGNQWRDEEVAHTLRLLEIIGRTDIPVVPGAVFPLVRRRDETQMWQQRYGKVAFAGAWDERWWHEPFVVPTLPEGQPATRPTEEDAAHFLIRKVHEFPHQVTIYEGGPMTNLALAISIDPDFPELAQELVFMGGSLSPQTDDPEFVNNPRHEFQFLVRSRGSTDRATRAVEEDRVYAGGHLDQDPPDASHDQTDRRERHSSGTLRRPLLPDRTGRRVYVGRACRGGMA
jgi:hypothetical protein